MSKKQTKEANSPLSTIEWDTLWMAIRYAMGGQTIATASLPPEIIKAYYSRLSDNQKKRICEDLKRHFEQWGQFGNPDIDNRIWLKFYHALNVDTHLIVTTIDGAEHVVFEVLGKIYPLAQYIENPHREIDLPIENIEIDPQLKKSIANLKGKKLSDIAHLPKDELNKWIADTCRYRHGASELVAGALLKLLINDSK